MFNRLSLDEFKFAKLSKGLYQFTFQIDGYETSEDSLQTFLDSKVATLKPLNNAPATISTN